MGLDGDLYVTTSASSTSARRRSSTRLPRSERLIVGTGALRLVVDDSPGVEIGVVDPRVLRVEIAAVREARATAEPERLG